MKPSRPRVTRREILELAALYPAGICLWWTQLEPLVRLLARLLPPW